MAECLHLRRRRYNSRPGQVAQLVEQRTENPRVGSSILSQATIRINSLGHPTGCPFLFCTIIMSGNEHKALRCLLLQAQYSDIWLISSNPQSY